MKKEILFLIQQTETFKFRCYCGELETIREQLVELKKVLEEFEVKTEPMLDVLDPNDFLSVKRGEDEPL